MWTVPLGLNNFKLPREGSFSLTLIYFGSCIFSTTVFWWLGVKIREMIIASHVYTDKKDREEESKVFYAEYLRHSHFSCSNSSCRFAPKAIEKLIASGYPKDRVYLVVSDAVVRNNFESVDELVSFVKQQDIRNRLQVRGGRK